MYSFVHHIVHIFRVPYDVKNPVVLILERSESGFRCMRQKKRIFVDFTKMKRGKASEYSVILSAFYKFFVKFLPSRPARSSFNRVVTMFWVLRSLHRTRATQRTSRSWAAADACGLALLVIQYPKLSIFLKRRNT